MKARILIVEDEADLATIVSMYLEREGIESRIAGSAEAAIPLLRAEAFDLILLDINLPGMDGFEFLQALRRDNNIPVIFVSARESDEDIVLGLGLGADEFIAKPVPPRNLVARIKALLRRVRQMAPTRPVFRFDDYSLDPDACLLRKGSERIKISAKELDVLLFLISAKGKAFSPKEIYEAVWGQLYGDLSIVGVYIQRIRKKIEADPQNPAYLETVQGKGYRFNDSRLQGGVPWV